LHQSHDVRGFRDHDSAFERVVGEVANSSVEMTFGSGSFMFGQEGAWPAEADLVGEWLEVRVYRDRGMEFERKIEAV